MVKTAVYSICKNEIKHIERWVNATQGADYRIVVDTGSTDGSQEKLRELGVTVYQLHLEPFRFDDARNVALNLLPADADVCVILDMDEVPAPDFFKIVKYGWQPNWDSAWITMETAPNRWQRDRLHSRNGWRWKYPCHEVNVWYKQGEPTYGDLSKAVITHMPDNSKSRGHYLEKLQMAVRELPHDARMNSYLTREYFFNAKWDEVIASANTMLECTPAWDVEQAACCRWAAEACRQLGRKEEATSWVDRGTSILPHEGEPWFYVSMDAYINQDWEKCLDASLKVLELPRSTHYCYEAEVWDWKAYDLASIASYNLKHIDEAIVFAQHAAEANGPETERIVRNLDFFRKVSNDLQSRNQGSQV